MRNMSNRKTTLIIILLIFVFVGMCYLIDRNKDKTITIYYDDMQVIYSINSKLVDDELLIKNNGAADSVINSVINDIVDKLGYTREKAIKIINSGCKITSTVNKSMEANLLEKFNDRNTFTKSDEGGFVQGSMVIMDYDCNIKAIAIGNNNDTTVNRVNKLIKPASTIKPIAIYAPAIEKDIIHYTSVVDDIPSVTYIDGKAAQWPQNYDYKYEINVNLSRAILRSKNTIAVNVGELLGENNSYDFLKNSLGFDTLVDTNNQDNDMQLSALALGYLTNGITLDKLVAAYSIFGNEGYYQEPKLYTKIEDNKGNIILENQYEKTQVISEETATIMNRLLLNVINHTEGTGSAAKIDGFEIVGKTGTIGKNGDVTSQLFVGLTPTYIAGVWLGYDNNSKMYQNTYNQPSAIWKTVMKDNLGDKKTFKLSNQIEELEFCNKSGNLKSKNCKSTEIGYYKQNKIPDKCVMCTN